MRNDLFSHPLDIDLDQGGLDLYAEELPEQVQFLGDCLSTGSTFSCVGGCYATASTAGSIISCGSPPPPTPSCTCPA